VHQLDKVVVDDIAVPGGDERLGQLALVGRMFPGYLEGHFVPEISIGFIQRLRGPIQCCDVVPALPFGHQFCTMARHIVILEQ
jgi:hypothetical protein